MSILKGVNLTTVFLILGISGFGLLTIFVQNSQLAVQQFLFFLLGLLFFFVISSFDVRILKDVSAGLWLVSLILVLLVTFFGPEIRGAHRWIELGFFRFQPTELAKPALILFLAQILTKNSAEPIFNLLKSLAVMAPFAVLAFLQPDLGNAIIFLAIWFLAVFISGYSWKIIGALAAFFLAILPAIFGVLAPYQRLRLETFLNPADDPLGAGYTVIQSQIAVGAGRIFGQGLTGATQSKLEFLPEAPTDFIFASLAESFGFFGSLIFIFLFLTLVYQIAKAAKFQDRFSQILILEIAGVLFFQFFINLAMGVGLLPVVGVTLPFVSYGGSSLVASFILLGLFQSQIRFATKP